MTVDDLKRYSVMVGGGSGCLFQPMSEAYTYIVTAKHLFYDTVENGRGNKRSVEKVDGSIVQIIIQIKNEDMWSETTTDFVIAKGENYFPHEQADIAILKIPLTDLDYSAISGVNYTGKESDFFLCGFPEVRRANAQGERYTTHQVQKVLATGNFARGAQLNGNLAQQDIDGMSGGGIMKATEGGIALLGIQSKMASKLFPAGQIGYVPIEYAREIIGYDVYAGKMSKLMPRHLLNFSFLRNDSFLLVGDAIDFDNIEAVKQTLRNKAIKITESDITPSGIRGLFKSRLLVSENDSDCLCNRNVWVAWLEFLTIMNLVKYENIDSTMLSAIFDSYRLKYANVDDWTNLFREELLKSDYNGLKVDSIVVVSTNKPPTTTFLVPKGKMIDIIRPYDKKGFKTDEGMDPYISFNFVHLEYFKKNCIMDKIAEYANLTEEQLTEKLKLEYNALFN